MENPIYLGDAVYATMTDKVEGYFTLTTGSHKPQDASEVIYFDPQTGQALVNWLGQWGIKCK